MKREPVDLWDFLEFSQTLRTYYHDALWEEQKHFTWWVSIILPVLVLIYSSEHLCALQKALLITLGSLFGIFLSAMGYVVIRRESMFFTEAMESFRRANRALGLHEHSTTAEDSKKEPPLMPKLTISDTFEEAQDRGRKSTMGLLLGLLRPSRLTIRDCFQLVFIASGLLYCALLFFTWLTLWSAI